MSAETLIIGATGFIGKNLLSFLLNKNEKVRVLARNPQKIILKDPNLEVFEGDLEKKETLTSALDGIKTIYYLAHAMDSNETHFLSKEVLQANNLAELLKNRHRVIYLGGIIPEGILSEHLQSRMKVGQILASSEAEAVEFRASIVIGNGSASYDMVRALVRRLPFILKTNWSEALCQPIALENVIEYLYEAKLIPLDEKNNIINIGGKNKVPYRELMSQYAKSEHLARPIIEIQVFPKLLAQELLKIVAPEFYQVGSKLLESIEHETIVLDQKAEDLFKIKLYSLEEMIKRVSPLNIEKLDHKEILRKIKTSEKLSILMENQVLTLTIPVADAVLLSKIQKAIASILPTLGQFKQNLHLKIPLVGEFNSTFDDDQKYLIINYKPLYFFQELSWVFWDKILQQIQNILSKEK